MAATDTPTGPFTDWIGHHGLEGWVQGFMFTLGNSKFPNFVKTCFPMRELKWFPSHLGFSGIWQDFLKKWPKVPGHHHQACLSAARSLVLIRTPDQPSEANHSIFSSFLIKEVIRQRTLAFPLGPCALEDAILCLPGCHICVLWSLTCCWLSSGWLCPMLFPVHSFNQLGHWMTSRNSAPCDESVYIRAAKGSRTACLLCLQSSSYWLLLVWPTKLRSRTLCFL